ncbi:MAG: SRPBCC domain-containing protein [Dehalococcoidia bacterium]
MDQLLNPGQHRIRSYGTGGRMYGSKRQIVINAPPEQVFQYLVDFSRHHEWNGEEAHPLRPTQNIPLGVGSTFAASWTKTTTGEYGQKGLKTFELEETITDIIPNTRLTLRLNWTDHLASLISLEIESVDGGTKVTVVTDEIMTWWAWLFWLIFLPFWPLISLWVSLEVRRMLFRIKMQLDL